MPGEIAPPDGSPQVTRDDIHKPVVGEGSYSQPALLTVCRTSTVSSANIWSASLASNRPES